MISSVPVAPLFVDADAWIAYVDKGDPRHTVVLQCINNSPSGTVTSEHEIIELCRRELENNLKNALIHLTWSIYQGEIAKLITPNETEEVTAWKQYVDLNVPDISYTKCLSAVLIHKHGYGVCDSSRIG